MSGTVRPDSEAVRRALDAILSSEAFARSERLRSFLGYVVENELSGKAATLKGYSIGIDVFGRPPGFDAGNDPLVRVQAGKLRKLLDHYYETDGADEALRIRIPLGSYVPEYEMRATPPAAGPEALPEPPPAAPPPHHRRRRARGGWLPAPVSSPLALFSLLPLFFLAPTTYPGTTSAAIDEPGLTRAVQDRLSGRANALPRVQILQCWPANGECSALAEALAASIAYHKTVRIDDRQDGDGAPLAYSVRIDNQPDGRALFMRLVHDQTGATVYARHLWREELSSESSITYEAVSFAARTLSPNGLVYRHALRAGIASSLMRCLADTVQSAPPGGPETVDPEACPLGMPEAVAEAAPDGDGRPADRTLMR